MAVLFMHISALGAISVCYDEKFYMTVIVYHISE